MLILVNRKQNDPITILSMQSVKYFFPGVYLKNGGGVIISSPSGGKI